MILLFAALILIGQSWPANAHPTSSAARDEMVHRGQSAERESTAVPIAPRDVRAEEFSPASAGAATPPVEPSAPAPTGIAIALLALAAALIVVGRRVLALALALLILVLTFETGIHSVHHLGSPQDAPNCAVAAASAHAPGAVSESVVTVTRPACADTVPVGPKPVNPALPTWGAWRGRAPPSVSLT